MEARGYVYILISLLYHLLYAGQQECLLLQFLVSQTDDILRWSQFVQNNRCIVKCASSLRACSGVSRGILFTIWLALCFLGEENHNNIGSQPSGNHLFKDTLLLVALACSDSGSKKASTLALFFLFCFFPLWAITQEPIRSLILSVMVGLLKPADFTKNLSEERNGKKLLSDFT